MLRAFLAKTVTRLPSVHNSTVPATHSICTTSHYHASPVVPTSYPSATNTNRTPLHSGTSYPTWYRHDHTHTHALPGAAAGGADDAPPPSPPSRSNAPPPPPAERDSIEYALIVPHTTHAYCATYHTRLTVPRITHANCTMHYTSLLCHAQPMPTSALLYLMVRDVHTLYHKRKLSHGTRNYYADEHHACHLDVDVPSPPQATMKSTLYTGIPPLLVAAGAAAPPPRDSPSKPSPRPPPPSPRPLPPLGAACPDPPNPPSPVEPKKSAAGAAACCDGGGGPPKSRSSKLRHTHTHCTHPHIHTRTHTHPHIHTLSAPSLRHC